MVEGDYCFYVYCVTVHFHKKKLASTNYHLVASSGSLLNTFLTIDIDRSIKYGRDIHLIFKVPWQPLLESVARFLPAFMSFYEDHNKECPRTKFEQFTSF